MNKCSYILTMHQTMLHSASTVEWVGDKIWKQCQSLSFCPHLSLSLAHIFGTIIPLFNRVVWSCFMPLHPHWLLFCPISPFLICLCVINNDRQKMGVHIGAPSCHHDASDPVQHQQPNSYKLNLLTKLSCIVSLLSAQRNARAVGSYSFWLTRNTLQWSRAAHMQSQPKEGSHNSRALKGGMNKEIKSPTWAFIVSDHRK